MKHVPLQNVYHYLLKLLAVQVSDHAQNWAVLPLEVGVAFHPQDQARGNVVHTLPSNMRQLAPTLT